MAPIPVERFKFMDPHPYMAIGAPYKDKSPWRLRLSVINALNMAQDLLEKQYPGWKIMLFDAWRPNEVQQFMVDREFLAVSGGRCPEDCSEAERDTFYEKAYRVWAIPSDDPKTPPPHSTGSVLDCTLANELGVEIGMGSPIDENSDRSNPDYFRNSTDIAGQKAHTNRTLLNDVMSGAGFHRNPIEWWHFSLGDQVWALIERQQKNIQTINAIYGRVE